MRIFVSSVRRGLEGERDALPGLLTVLGHDPVVFEKFTAKPQPSRQVCVDAVASSDAYILLLGAEYGSPMEDTGKSPTEEEFAAAKARGIPILVFHKMDVSFSDEQHDFARRVEIYTHGNFRSEFVNVRDLLPKVKLALDELGRAPGRLDWLPLPELASPEPVIMNLTNEYRPSVVLSLISVPPNRLSLMQLHGIGQRAERVLRDSNTISQRSGIESTTTADGSVTVRSVEQPTRTGNVLNGRTEGSFGGVAVSPNGQLTVWSLLPRDFIGTLLNRKSLGQDIASLLRIASQIDAVPSERVALAVTIAPADGVSEGDPAEVGSRTSGSMSVQRGRTLQTVADDSVAVAALLPAADEIADELARRVIELLGKMR